MYFPAIGGAPRHTSQNPRRYRSPSEHNIPFETHMIPCSDGTNLHSWLLFHPNSANNGGEGAPTIIFFHGNAGNIGMRLPNAIQMHHYLKANVWLIEYRGFGDSDDAKPNEGGLKLDAEAVWNYAHDRSNNNNLSRNVDPRRLFVFGRSLGGAVAFHLAQYAQTAKGNHPPLAGLIVENTFLSISDMVDHLMPYVRLFKMLVLRMDWNSAKVAPTIRAPTLFLAGAQDTLVPHSHMLGLFDRMKTSKSTNLVRMHIVENGTHNETWLQGGKAYWRALQRFIDEVFEAERASGDASYSRSIGGNAGGAKGTDGPFQRKGSAATPPVTGSSISETTEPVEVDMGCEGEDAADMIASVGNFMGMAREAVSGGGKTAYKKKD